MNTIQSKNNIKIKDLIKLRDDTKFRNDKSLFYVEGERIISDIPRKLISEIYVEKSKINKYESILSDFNADSIYVLDDNIFTKVKDTVNSQGIIATIKYNLLNNIDKELINNYENCILLDTIQDPGNLGTIIRTAEAGKVDLVVLTENCCNVYNNKVVRSSMSSLFKCNIHITKNALELIKVFKSCNYNIIGTTLSKDSIIYSKIDLRKKTLIILGNEGNGISDSIIENVDFKARIPMFGSIDSLNVATATAIILYEKLRQNNYYEN